MSLHLTQLIEQLKDRVARMTNMVLHLVETSVEAVTHVNPQAAELAMGMDDRIDAEEVAIEKSCIDLVALHAPAARDVRLVLMIIKVNSDFERIADCATNVAQRIVPLSKLPDYDPPQDLKLMANSVLGMLRDTIKAFNLLDDALARQVLRGDDVVDALYHQIVQDMLNMMEADGQKANTDLGNIMMAKNLERIADHCTNIAENVIYVHTGRIIRHMHTAPVA